MLQHKMAEGMVSGCKASFGIEDHSKTLSLWRHGMHLPCTVFFSRLSGLKWLPPPNYMG